MRIIFLIFLFFISLSIKAQRYFLPSSRMYDIGMQYELLKDSSSLFSSVKPVLNPIKSNPVLVKDKVPFKNWMYNHFFEENFLKFETEEHTLTVNPIFDFQRSFNLNDNSDDKVYFLNTRGFEAFGKLGNRIYFNTEFYENQARFLLYEDIIINKMGGIPGQGFAKPFKGNSNDNSGKDWALAFGTISIEANKNYTITLGNGKNFIGSGHRSVILSDISFNYPYIRSDIKFGNWYYYVLWQYLSCDGWVPFFNGQSHYKYGSYHIAGWKPNSKFELSVIEGVMWKNTDKNGVYKYSPNLEMFFPGMFYPFVAHGFNRDSRVQLGWDVNFSPINKLKLYQQFNYQGRDKLNCKNYCGFQLGVHFFDFLFDGFDSFDSHFQLEYNYSRISEGQSYTDFWNYGYPLTTMNVVDCKSNELLVFLELRYKRFSIDGKIQNVEWVNRQILNFRYFLNKKTKWNLYLSLQHRNALWHDMHYDNNILQIGMQICPQNFYFDF